MQSKQFVFTFICLLKKHKKKTKMLKIFFLKCRDYLFPQDFQLFIKAIEKGDLQQVIYLYEKKSINLNQYVETGDTALHIAVKNNKYDIVDYILSTS